MPIKKVNVSERVVTASIRQLLKTLGVFHWKQHQGLGSTPGIPDIIGVWKGRLLGIEVKTQRGIVSASQKQFIDRINSEGGIAFVARSVDDVIEALDLGDRFLIR
jgi:Holliday junction resolvase